jgi:hypothetical protein
MGKKSRRQKQNSDGKLPAHSSQRTAQFSPSNRTVVSQVSASSFENPFGNEKRPKNGWAREFREAERELRHHPESQDVVFRAAKAARVMRQFDRLDEIMKKAESKGLVIDDAEKFHLWNRWNEECASYKANGLGSMKHICNHSFRKL